MSDTLKTDLVYGGVAIIAFGLEQFHIIPTGAANVIIALVAGTAYGQAKLVLKQNLVKASE